MKYLLIAEKPSLMRSIRDCYINHKSEIVKKVGEIEFIALSGHVCRNAEPNEYPQWSNVPWMRISYPMVPAQWKTLPIKDSYKQKTLKELREKIAQCDALICATDSDVEGYGIHFMVSECLHLHNKPTLRFVEHSLTDKEILKSLLSMTDMHTDPVHIRFTNSYLVRSRADWLYGFNLSRVVTMATGTKKAVGRVKAPTIKMVYDRCNEIDGFVKRTYYQVAADYGDFRGVLVDETGKAVQYESKDETPTDIPADGVVAGVKEEKKVSHCQKLYDLSALQTDAGRAYGYSPQETLDAAQSLYEKHKVLSYPRTQCRYVSTERAKEFPSMLNALYAFPQISAVKGGVDVSRANNNRVVNDAEVQKEAHDALLPTGVVKDPGSLNEKERNIYWLVCKRLAEQFLPDAVDKKTTVLAAHPDMGGYMFKAEGSSVIERGFRVLSKERTQVSIPALKKGAALKAVSITPVECATRPAKRFTQASLAEAMENIASLIKNDKEAKASLAESKGIGQASTRAKIISEIIHFGYVEEKKGGLYITDSGREYVESLEGIGITDPIFAANLDMQIKRVQRGEESYDAAYGAVVESLTGAVKKAAAMGIGGATNVPCPSCGRQLVAGQWDYSCECGYKIRRRFCEHTISTEELKTLLSGGAIGPFHLKSKGGKNFDARLILKDGKITFPDETEQTEVRCPKCGTPLTASKYSYICGCGFKTPRIICDHEINAPEMESLFMGKEIGPFEMRNKAGKAFSAKLKMKADYSLEFIFPENGSSASGVEKSSLKCPSCGKALLKSRFSYYCSCGFKISHLICGVDLLEKDISVILSGQKAGPFNFTSKKGKKFNASLYMEGEEIKFDFV